MTEGYDHTVEGFRFAVYLFMLGYRYKLEPIDEEQEEEE